MRVRLLKQILRRTARIRPWPNPRKSQLVVDELLLIDDNATKKQRTIIALGDVPNDIAGRKARSTIGKFLIRRL